MAVDPLGLAEDVDEATARLLATIGGLTDQTVPSRLPGWTVGHVLTHLARNADGLVNLLIWARTGEMTPMYPSWDAREADIEAGAPRSVPEQLADLRHANDRFVAAVDAMPPVAWTATVQASLGPPMPAAQVMWSRLREVEIHHVDLGAGYTPADWPEAFVVRMLHNLQRELADRADAPRVVLRVPEIGHEVRLTPAAGTPVSGPGWAAVAWLIGRSAGEELTGALPPVPVWR